MAPVKEMPVLTDVSIMMVDDEPLEMEVIKIFLERVGYHRFITINKSTLALEAIQKARPDVLLLDLLMPEITGFDLLRAIRANDKLQYLPVIILTSSTEAETKQIALELGATDFLAKPVNSSELILRLHNTLAARAYQDAAAPPHKLNKEAVVAPLEYYANGTGKPHEL